MVAVAEGVRPGEIAKKYNCQGWLDAEYPESLYILARILEEKLKDPSFISETENIKRSIEAILSMADLYYGI